MDPDRVVLEISSDDEEVVGPGWGGGSKRICDGDDHNWLTELLDEVDRETDDSDDVVVVSEVVISPPNKQRLKKDSLKGLDDDDDECVILDGDPDEAVAVRSDGGGDGVDGDGDDDDDELVVVSEKGQVACRDYPHPRHLCVQFPFSSTSHERYCDQCHCYVCESLAPCVHWGAGHSSIDHCHAHDKEEYWRAQRKSTRSGDKVFVPVPKVADASFSVRLPQLNQIPPLPAMLLPIGGHHHQVSRPTSLRACSMSTNFPMPNLISQSRSQCSVYHTPRNRFQPNLVSQQLLSTCNSSTNPRDRRHNSGSGNLGPHVPRAAFKRTGSAGVAPTNARGSYSSSRVTHESQYLRSSPPVATRNPTRVREFHDVIVSGSNSSVGPSQPVMANVFDSVPSRGTFFEKPLHYQSPILPPHPTADTLYENPVIFQSEVTPQPNGGSTPVSSLPSQPQVSVQPNYPVPSQLQMPPLQSLTDPPQPQVSVQPNYSVHSSSPNYSVPSQPQLSSQSRIPVLSETQVNTQYIPVSDYSQNIAEQQIQTETDVDPDLPDFDFSWMTPSTENCQQPSTKNTQAECIAPTSEHSLVADPGLVDDFQYDSWIFDNQPVEPGTMDVTVSSGTNGFSPEPGLIDTGLSLCGYVLHCDLLTVGGLNFVVRKEEFNGCF